MKALAALPSEWQAELERDPIALAERHNRAGAGTLSAPREYLEVIIGVR